MRWKTKTVITKTISWTLIIIWWALHLVKLLLRTLRTKHKGNIWFQLTAEIASRKISKNPYISLHLPVGQGLWKGWFNRASRLQIHITASPTKSFQKWYISNCDVTRLSGKQLKSPERLNKHTHLILDLALNSSVSLSANFNKKIVGQDWVNCLQHLRTALYGLTVTVNLFL